MIIALASLVQHVPPIFHCQKVTTISAVALALGFFLLPGNAADVTQTQNPIDVGERFSISEKYQPGDEFMSIRLLGAVRLTAKAVRGEKPRELSGLAWDQDEELLISISDDGFIVHLEPVFTGEQLTDLRMAAIFPLLGPTGDVLEKKLTDAEGLVGHNMDNGTRGDSFLSISFEEQPRIDDYSLTGQYLRTHTLPEILNASENYAGDNLELEALTKHPLYGIITAPERPLRNSGTQSFSLYGVDGEVWHYPSLDKEHSALVGMETTPGGNILVLERRFASMFQPIVFAVRELQLSTPASHQALVVRDVVKFSSTDGWKIDNFESVAHHRNNRYFVVSDDNESLFQKTLLVYFEINEVPQQSPAKTR
ncbi:MAG: esterase-like activity of phytase family protein [Gammaproteobacteria bacterium]